MTNGIGNIVDWLSGKNGEEYKTSYLYDYIHNRLYAGKPDVARSYALRLLIHYLGDLHQPLHAMGRYNDDYPTGDKGGNLFPIKYHYEADELHAVWDKVLYMQHSNLARPLTQDVYDTFQSSTVDPYMKKYKYEMSQPMINNLDYNKWAQESHDKAMKVYDGAVETEALS